MNAALPLFAADTPDRDRSANLLAAARTLAPHLFRGRPLERRTVSAVLTTAFGATDADGAWDWRDAYDAIEAAMVLQVRRLGPQVSRLEDAPGEILTALADMAALGLTHTRRSEHQLALDQFSTPAPWAALLVLAAQVRSGDQVLEPSAGIGMVAALAEACGAQVVLNELSERRAGLLDGLFPGAARTRLDAAHLGDLLPAAGAFHVVVMNPPFAGLGSHLLAALACLADGGRLAAIVPATALSDADLLAMLRRHGRLVGGLSLPPGAFLKHGTNIDTGLLVIDRGEGGAGLEVATADDLAQAAAWASALPARPTAQARIARPAPSGLVPRTRTLRGSTMALRVVEGAAPLDYAVCDWSGEGRDVGLYQAWRPGRIVFAQAHPHPTPLVESGAMASVAPPAPSYRPMLPPHLRAEGQLSDAQAETVIYAGEAHAALLAGAWTLSDAPHELRRVEDGTEGAEGGFQLRRGMFLGDGTGAGKGRQIAAVIADNMAQGRVRALWFSRNEALLEDAQRDWKAIGGSAHDVIAQARWKLGEAIGLERGVLFTTYATLRQPARGGRASRLDQIVTWLGADFDGVVVFDEAHAMGGAAGGAGARGPKKASQQGLAGLALQNRLPSARVFYVSATGATEPANLAYASRLGLWGGPEAPFATRADFLEAAEAGGIAFMELVARELKAMGLYVARSLSFEGVEYTPLEHPLTADDVAIWDAWADAFQVIHANLGAALKAVGVCDDEGKVQSGAALSALRSAFESAKLRFFGHLLAGLKAPTLIAAIRTDLAAGRSSVVQIVSTNEAVMSRRLAEIPPEEWSNLSVDLTPKEYVLDYLRGAFPTALMEAIEGEDGEVTLVPVMQDGHPVHSQEALRLRDETIAGLASLPAVPGVLDAVLDGFGTGAVAEITGRTRRVVLRDGRRVVERRSASAAKAETDAFMDGRKRVLVFSDAGGTGRSYHAALDAMNRQRRVHYLVEPGWRADAAIQGLGRTHRTHQASAPLFRPATTDIHGEKRFLSTIARRLDSLGALTRGERRVAGAGLFRAEDNLESPWARRALMVLYGALAWGELESMSLGDFEAKTGLSLLDSEGLLKGADDLPPITTFLNRLLALRIADQNALFADYEKILAGVIERAAAAGLLDHGVEDIVAEDLQVLSEETVRTDPGSGAETRLIGFRLRSRREFLRADEALGLAERLGEAAILAVNGRSGRAALVELGLTTTDDNDRLLPAVRLRRPEGKSLETAKAFEESAWAPAEAGAWRAIWEAEIAAADPWRTRELTLATGLLLPVWARLPAKGAQVRRVKAPDGRRWLGRVLDASQVAALKAALGVTSLAEAWSDGSLVLREVLERGVQLGLAGGFWLRRARVMDRWRIEVVGGAGDRASLVALGCFTEIIAYTLRVFVPVDGPDVAAAVVGRHAVVQALDPGS
ncbi:strawberry notch family protein [uncultured Phenylobacterium sp.]|uniref:strawberry notch family protein n=1 Tax=uncultured Phenylobacterium sp. TaxID=349273 RepID=UPI0025D1E385|nr:strawberry notch family protein [uncultured Phenylobacterium sp.]